jgi:hypothetical protein
MKRDGRLPELLRYYELNWQYRIVGAREAGKGWEGLYGRPWVGMIPLVGSNESVTKGAIGKQDGAGIFQWVQEEARRATIKALPAPLYRPRPYGYW